MPLDRDVAFSVTVRWVQLLDAALVWLGFWVASLFRGPIREFISPVASPGDMSLWQMSWIFYIVVPFTPLVLEFFQFYRRPRPRSASLALGQLFKAAICMTLLVAALIAFAQIGGASRIILMTGGVLTLLLLFARDRLSSTFQNRETPGPSSPH